MVKRYCPYKEMLPLTSECIWTIFGLQPNKIKLVALPIFSTQQFLSFFIQPQKKKLPPQRQDPLCLPGRAQLPGHRVQVQGGRRDQRDAGQLLLPPCELTIVSLDFVFIPGTYTEKR